MTEDPRETHETFKTIALRRVREADALFLESRARSTTATTPEADTQKIAHLRQTAAVYAALAQLEAAAEHAVPLSTLVVCPHCGGRFDPLDAGAGPVGLTPSGLARIRRAD